MCKKDVEKFLKGALDADMNAKAAQDAIDALDTRRPTSTPLIYEFFRDLVNTNEHEEEVGRMIAHLPEGILRDVFTKRYINKMTWEASAEACYISLAYAHKLHAQGLEILQKISQTGQSHL